MTLVLDLFRHGDAEPVAMGGDEGRALSPRGLANTSILAGRLRRDGFKPTHALTSPLRRARETTSILLANLKDSPVPEELDALTPEAEPGEVLELLEQRGIRSGHVVLVSHQPLIGRLAAYLTGVEGTFHPGTLVRVTCKNGLGRGQGTVTLTVHPAKPS